MINLRHYQEKMITGIRESIYKGNKRIIACLSTGGGKSPIIGELAKSSLEKNKKSIIVLPRRSLVTQLSRSFHYWNIPHGLIMSGYKPSFEKNCQIVSIDTYMSRIEKGWLDFLNSDLLIVDELQEQFSKKKLKLFENYKYVVGFSATPVAQRGRNLGEFYEDIIEPIQMTELQEQGFLCDLRYFTGTKEPDLSRLSIDYKTGDYKQSDAAECVDKKELVGDIFDNWLRITGGNKSTVIFASSRDHAKHLCEEFNSKGYKFLYVDCNYKEEERQEIFKQVESGDAIGIVNYSIVSIGIDIPCLEVCVLARPTRLIKVYMQCVGRVTRMYEGKDYGYVIDHAGIIKSLGFAEDVHEWMLNETETLEERTKNKKEQNKEYKPIKCPQCNSIYKGAVKCPYCGYTIQTKNGKIPVHEAELKEVTKVKSIDKQKFYSELLGYAKSKGKTDSYALALFRKKFNEWPYNKKSIEPSEPSQETLGYIKHCNIKYSRRKH